MWDEFQFIEHGGRRSLPRSVHGFAAGGAYAGHRIQATGGVFLKRNSRNVCVHTP